jgi:hypothetical protein
MNEIDPASRFTVDAVRKFDDGVDHRSQPTSINNIALQVASQYRRDTMSPVMVSGVLRIIEFAVLLVSGVALYAHYVGFNTALYWHYPAIVAGGSLLTVILLELTDMYQISALRRPFANVGRLLLVWSGTSGAGRLLHEDLGGLLAILVRRLVRHRLRLPLRPARGGVANGAALGAQRRHGAARRDRRRRQGSRGADPLDRAQPDNDIRICGIFDDRDNRRSPPSSPAIRSSATSPN